jgi:hypothetical protein
MSRFPGVRTTFGCYRLPGETVNVCEFGQSRIENVLILGRRERCGGSATRGPARFSHDASDLRTLVPYP